MDSLNGVSTNALTGDHRHEVVLLDQLQHDLSSANELAVDVKLWVGRPIGVVLEPFFHLLIEEDIVTFVLDLEIFQLFDHLSASSAGWSRVRSPDEDYD